VTIRALTIAKREALLIKYPPKQNIIIQTPWSVDHFLPKTTSLPSYNSSLAPPTSAATAPSPALPPTPPPAASLPPDPDPAASAPSGSLKQGLTLVHFSAQPEPFLTQNTPEYPLTPLENPPNTPCVQLLTHSKRLR